MFGKNVLRRLGALAVLFLCNAGGLYGFIHLWYQSYDPDTLLPVWGDGLWGYVSQDGKPAIDMLFDDASLFNSGLAMVCSSSSKGYFFINGQGKAAFGRVFESARPFSESVAWVKFDDRWHLIDTSGDTVVSLPIEIIDVGDFSEGLARFDTESGEGQHFRSGYLGMDGSIVIAARYRFASDFHEGVAAVTLPGDEEQRDILIDRTGTQITERAYDYLGRSHEHALSAELDGLWGILSSDGQVLVPFRYRDGVGFREGLAGMKDDEGRWGFIDKQGTWVIPPRYASVIGFTGGFTTVEKFPEHNEGLTVIDRSGNECFTVEGATSAAPWRNGVAAFVTHDRLCYIDTRGNLIWPRPESGFPPCSIKFVDEVSRSNLGGPPQMGLGKGSSGGRLFSYGCPDSL